jgi:hypothetical protein
VVVEQAASPRGEYGVASEGAAVRSEPEAVFIVGVSRSGTTLMRRVLDRHPRLAIATENHYLGHLLEREGARHYFRALGDPRDDATMRRIVDLIWSREFEHQSWLREPSPYWDWLVRRVPRADFERRLLDSDRTERGIFTAILRAYADKRRRPIMGEKTPAHLGYVETLLDWYPDARVIHMLRDPRAIYVSEARRRADHAVTFPYRYLVHVPPALRAFVIHEVAWAWAKAVSRHRELSRLYPDRYRLVQFERLVTEPQATIEEVLAFIGVPMHPRVMRQRVYSKGARWGEPGFDADAATRWRGTIDPRADAWLRLLLGRRLEEFGYR